jgi:hypothetical protein
MVLLPEIYQGTGFKLRADARFDSCSFSEGWCPGATAITNLSKVQEQKLRSPALRGKLRDEPEPRSWRDKLRGARRSQPTEGSSPKVNPAMAGQKP